MKQLVYTLLTLILVSCGSDSGQFRIEGRFKNLNRGEFYVYSPDGGIQGVDTIKVADGRFAYATPINGHAMFMLIFPNFSEQPVFGGPGVTATINGDVSHLKELEIKGSDANKELTAFRLRTNSMSPPEAAKAAKDFVEEHPESPLCRYLIDKYLVRTYSPDYSEAYRLATLALKSRPDDARLALFATQLDKLKANGHRLPAFSATGIDGKKVGPKELKAKVNIVSLWASWSYESQTNQRWIKKLKKQYGSDIAVVSICLDAHQRDCRRQIKTDSIGWPNICDGKLWQSPAVKAFGFGTMPATVIADSHGRIVARNLTREKLKEKVESLLKQGGS